MAKLGTAVGGGVTVVITCALLSLVYTPEQISELIGNTTSALTINNLDNAQPQFILDNGDIQNHVDYANGVGSEFDQASNPQQKPPPSQNRARKPTTAPLNGTADYFQRTMAISKLFYTNEKLSYIRMGMEITSVLLVGLIWRFCFRKGPSPNEEKLKKEVADLQAQLTKLRTSSTSTGGLIAPLSVDQKLVRTQIQDTTTRLTTKITSLEQKIVALDTKFEQCYKMFNVLCQVLKYLYQNVEFKNTNTNTNNNIIMLNAYIESAKGSSSLDNELVDTSSSNILKTKNFPHDSFSNQSDITVQTVSIDASLDTSRNLSNSSLLLSPIKKEPKNFQDSHGLPELISDFENAGTTPLPAPSKASSNEIKSVMEDPVVTVEVRATPWRPPMRDRRKKEENSTEVSPAPSTVPANQASAQVQQEQQELIRDLQDKLSATEDAKRHLEDSIAELEEQINALQSSHEAEKAELQQKIVEAQNISSSLESKLTSAEQELEGTAVSLKQATEQLESEKASKQLLQTQLDELKSQMEQHEKNMKADDSQIRQQFSELQSQHKHLQIQYNIAETELTVLQSEHASLQSEHNTQCSERIHALELVNEITKKENETLQAELALASSSVSEVEKLKSQLEDANVEVQMMEDKYEALQKELVESNNEIARINLSSLGSVEQQERQYQDAHHQQQIVAELLDKIQKLENEIFELRADAVDGATHVEMSTQTETDVDQMSVELQLAQAELEEKTNYIQELETHFKALQVEQLKNALESQLPSNLTENANAVVDSVSREDASTETESSNDNSTQSTPDSKATDKKTPQNKKPTVHDRLHQHEHHCPACDLAAQGTPSNLPHTNHATTPSPSANRTRSLSLSSGRNPPKGRVSAANSFAKAKPSSTTKGTTSKTTTPASSRPSSPPPRGRQPSRSLYPTTSAPQVAPAIANLVVVSNEDTPHIVPGAPILEPNKKFLFAPSSMNIRKTTTRAQRKRSLSFTHQSFVPPNYPVSPSTEQESK